MLNYTLILILVLILIYFSEFEQFEVVAYNNEKIPNYKIESIYDTESKELQKVFDNLNSTNKNFKKSVIDDSFVLLNINLPFEFTKIFKQFILDYLIDNIPKFKKDKVYILGNLINIYQKDSVATNNVIDRTFVFNVTLVNPVNFFTRNIRIRLTLKNVNLILDESSNYTNTENDIIIKQLINLESIDLDKNNYKNFTFTPSDSLGNSNYLITNKYHLLDPFSTSGKNMLITENDKIIFQNVLNEKKQTLTSEYNSYTNKYIQV